MRLTKPVANHSKKLSICWCSARSQVSGKLLRLGDPSVVSSPQWTASGRSAFSALA